MSTQSQVPFASFNMVFNPDSKNNVGYEFGGMFEDFSRQFDNPEARNLAELVRFNEEHVSWKLLIGESTS